MHGRILATVDGSPFAEAIIPCAATIAASLQTPLHIIRIAHEGEASEAESYVQQLATALGAKGTTVVTDALPAPAILALAPHEPAGLIAMATHGRGGLLESVMGSVASEVLREASAPLLLLRPSGQPADLRERYAIKTVVIALDGSDYSERVIAPAAELARLVGAGVKVVQAVSPDVRVEGVKSGDVVETSYVRSRAESIHEKYGLAPDWDILHGDPARAISDGVRDAEGAVLAMASHARRPLKKAIAGSVTSACLRQAGVPVLVVGPAFAA